MIYASPLKVSLDILYASFNSTLANNLKPSLLSYHILKSSDLGRSKNSLLSQQNLLLHPSIPVPNRLVKTDQHSLLLHEDAIHTDADCKHEEKVSSLIRKLWAERKPCDNWNISRAIHWQNPRVAADQGWLVTPS